MDTRKAAADRKTEHNFVGERPPVGAPVPVGPGRPGEPVQEARAQLLHRGRAPAPRVQVQVQVQAQLFQV